MSRASSFAWAITCSSSQSAFGFRFTARRAKRKKRAETGGESPLRVYVYGERLHFTSKLRLPRNYRNPGAMDLAGYLASQGIRLTGSAHANDVEVLPGFVGQPNRSVAQRRAAQRARAHHAALARRARRADAGCAHRRPCLLRARDQDRLPAHRHLSHPGRLRNQCRHSRVRRVLGAAALALRRDLGDDSDHSAVVGIRIRRRPGIADCARDHHAEHLPADTAAVSRSRRPERAGHCRARNPAGQPAHTV